MKKSLLFFAMAALFCGAAEPKTVKFDFATQPEMSSARYPNTKKFDYLEKSIAIPEISEKNFAVEFKLNITRINPYGNIWVGISSSKRKLQNAFIRFGKSDSGPLIHFYSGVGFGSNPATAKPWKGLQKQAYIVRMEYNAGSMQIRYQINDSSGKLLHDTGFVTCRIPLNPDRISFRANDGIELGVSVINYNAEKQCIFARSLLGYEKQTPYLMEMDINEVTLVF
jgi:hypothetical protein